MSTDTPVMKTAEEYYNEAMKRAAQRRTDRGVSPQAHWPNREECIAAMQEAMSESSREGFRDGFRCGAAAINPTAAIARAAAKGRLS